MKRRGIKKRWEQLINIDDGKFDPDLEKKERTLPDVSIPQIPWYRQAGIKRSVGFVLLGIGQIVGGGIGLAIQGIGGLVGTVGLADAARKSSPKTDGQQGLWFHLVEIVKILIKTISTHKKKGK